MEYVRQFTIEDGIMQDDIDILFQGLQRVEPPPALIAHILRHAQARATMMAPPASQLQGVEMSELVGWLARKEKRRLC